MSKNVRTALLLAALALVFFVAVIVRQVLYGLPG
ncbi:cytochrome oxidase small assembly protein [Jeongeupia wiesaeckerbachi]